MLIENMKKNKTIQRLMEELKNKYIKQGKLTGKILFVVKDEDERRIMSEFIDLKYYDYKTKEFKVNIRQLEKKMQELLKDDISLIEFIEKHFYEKKITTKKEKKEKELYEQTTFYKKLKERYPILKEFIEQRAMLLEVFCKRDSDRIEEEVKKLNDIVLFVKTQESTTLPFLANHLFKDSHALDIGTTTFNILIHYICFTEGYEMESRLIEEKNKVLELMNIKRDEVSNNFLTYNLLRRNDVVLNAAYQEDEVYTINLKKIQSSDEPFEGVGDKIFVVENNLVFQRLTEEIGKKATIICSSGQFNTAFFEFLKRIREGTRVFYAGDFDPEGLYMLENISSRVELLFPLLMTKKIYEENEKEKEIPESRLKSLSKLKYVDKELIESIQTHKKALYQEEIYEELLKEIKMN